jgi:osmoprotectant transport system permease protein
MNVFEFMITRREALWHLTVEHFYLVFLAVLIAVIIGIIVGIIITYSYTASVVALTICQVLMTVPSMAMLGFLLPFFGIGFRTGMIALILYSLLPIVRNTYTGIREIPNSILESAYGMGMTPWHVLLRIQIPLALPVIMAGIRTATVMVIGIAAIASYIGAGGLGELIFHGISRTQPYRILAGAILISIMAVLADLILGWVEERLMVR